MGADHTTQDWLDWLDEQDLVHPVAPPPQGACSRCLGAVGGFRYDGLPFDECPRCHDLPDDPLDGFVPIVYSTDDTVESMLHRYKDWRRRRWDDYTWLAFPLGSLLAEFWDHHESCLRLAHGRFDLAVTVPSDDRERGFDQLVAINEVLGPPILDIVSGVMTRDFDEPRPSRGEVRPTAYCVTAPGDVEGSRVLLFDDTWTSGASMRSAAGALKLAGAESVVGLTIGRQLNRADNWGTTALILEELGSRSTEETCLHCA